jgi:RNA polymerase sigma-70 factor (ECF subfamily)
MDALGTVALARMQSDLVAAASAGDLAAFDRLVELHAAAVFRLALRMLGDRQEAEDVQQETFLQAYRRLRTFRGEASFGTWVYAIAARVCLARLRRARRRPEVIPIKADQPAPGADPLEQVSARQTSARAWRALAALSPSERLVILLRYVEGLSHEQVAQVLGCSVQANRARLTRARRAFRAQYGEVE